MRVCFHINITKYTLYIYTQIYITKYINQTEKCHHCPPTGTFIANPAECNGNQGCSNGLLKILTSIT